MTTPRPILPQNPFSTREYTITYGVRAVFRRWADQNDVDYVEDKRSLKSVFVVEAFETEHTEIRRLFLGRKHQ